MNAALKQICCCSWKGDVRVRDDAMCAVHGVDQTIKARRELQGQIGATAEGLRHLRTEAMTALNLYRRTKRRLIDMRKQLESL